MSAPVVVLGATGNIGSRIAEFLLERHEPVRLVSRNADRLGAFADRGAEPREGSVEDAEFLTGVLEGARAAFLLIPPAPGTADLRAFQRRVSEAEVEAVRASGVPYVVNLSSVGAEVPFGTGPIAGLHEHEQRLNSVDGVHVVHLRPATFMENLLGAIGSIRGAGVHLNPTRGDLPLPMIATQDIAAAADRLLAELGFEGKSTQELLGPREYTMEEATRILGEAIGKPDLAYSQVTPEEARQALLAAGASADEADVYLEMVAAVNSGKVRPSEPRLPENTTPTTLEEFARTTFAPVYRATEG